MTATIIAQLEEGCLPWVQPWQTDDAAFGLPRNAVTGRPYSGINILILWNALFGSGYATQKWLTYRQAMALGGSVRKGESGVGICYADTFVPKGADGQAEVGADGGPRHIPFLKRFTIFNIDQCVDLPEDLYGEDTGADPAIIVPHAETLIKASGADIRIGGSLAYYAPGEDRIHVPRRQLFGAPIDYYRTVLHELGHNAAIRIMPHGVCWRLVFRASAMRRFGIIRGLPRTRGACRRGGTGLTGWLEGRRERAPFPSSACRRGCRSGWSRHSRDQARARSPLDRRRGGAGPLPCCGEAYAV
ncbi:DUF1738 domain-containing protein [Sphingobium phenoxybenzoativorans]|uniref:DUF1738 domain-containing protein n=1 Tax=Sphingobium phenoxybenzoativorans TaxID=1592790 RepID=A0A975K6E2_9SPHN|nr:DUF1738 domain-containing protein [Sphingobium phenoxybenzoativorans]